MNNNPTAAQILSAPLSLVLLGVALSMFQVSALGQSPVSLDVKRDTPGQLIKPGQSVRMDVELALVNITVTDPHDRIVTGLEADNLRISTQVEVDR